MLSSAAARAIAIVLFFIVISFIKINLSTIAPTRSDNIVFQHIVGELYTATIIVVRLLQKYNAQNQARCRLASNKQIPALTETFKLSALPGNCQSPCCSRVDLPSLKVSASDII
jgi:hypothetical protein